MKKKLGGKIGIGEIESRVAAFSPLPRDVIALCISFIFFPKFFVIVVERDTQTHIGRREREREREKKKILIRKPIL